MEKIILSEDVIALREQVQKAIVEKITDGLTNGTITEEKAKIMAQFVLDKLPENITYDEFFKILPELDDDYPEFSDVVVPLMTQIETKNKAIMDKEITGLIKNGKIDEALNLTNKAIEEEKNLT